MMDEKPNVRPGSDAAYKGLLRLHHENQCLGAERDRVRRERDAAASGWAASKKEVAELEHKVTMQEYEIEGLKAEIEALKEISVEESQPPPPAAPIPPAERANIIEISDDEAAAGANERQVPVTTVEAATIPESRPVEQETTSEKASRTLQFVDPNKSEIKDSSLLSIVPNASGGLTELSTNENNNGCKRQENSSTSVSPKNIREHQTPQRQRQFMDHQATPSAGDSTTPGRFKRLRSPSPLPQRLASSALSTLVDPDYGDDDGDPMPASSRRSATIRTAPCTQGPPAKRLKKSKTEDVKNDGLKDVADIYLTHTPAHAIDPAPNPTLYVSRKFLLDEFGVLNQTFLGYFRPTSSVAERRRQGAIFPQPFLNPFLPPAPGAPGLIFASRFEIVEDHDGMPWALFCKHTGANGKVVWRYMGDYRNRHCGDLTKEQFRRQEGGVQQQWGKLLLKSKKVPAYIAMRARIALRKANIDFVPGDATEEREMAEVTKRGGKGKPLPVGSRISIGIIKLECVSYNHALAEEMERREAGWTGPAPRAKPSKARISKASQAGGTRRKQPCKSNVNAESESEYAPESEENSEHEARSRDPRRTVTRTSDSPASRGEGFHTGTGAGEGEARAWADSEMSDLTELDAESDEEGS
ncbi:hypothetical protein C8R45DRAFT_1043504 [Mycena sanguinolenta]|nr:hypothetical protein C8R45DRAFT_1043504 [Mycena sanguinolenta]